MKENLGLTILILRDFNAKGAETLQEYFLVLFVTTLRARKERKVKPYYFVGWFKECATEPTKYSRALRSEERRVGKEC